MNRVARELAALGEAELGASELAQASGGPPDAVRDVTWMFEVADTPGRPLDTVAQRRVWNRVARMVRARDASSAHGGGAGHGRVWISVAVGLAVAAGIALTSPIGLPPPGHTSTGVVAGSPDVRELAVVARRGLDALGGPTGTDRARAMARDYAQRLEAER